MRKIIQKLKDNAKKLALLLPAIFMALKDHRTPKIAKVFGGLTLFYALSPLDLIPDFIPVLGYVDDLLLLPLLGALTLRFIDKGIMEEAMERVKILWPKGLQGKWYYSLPVLLLWGILLRVLLK